MITISAWAVVYLVASVLLGWIAAWNYAMRHTRRCSEDLQKATEFMDRYREERDEAVSKYRALVAVATVGELKKAALKRVARPKRPR